MPRIQAMIEGKGSLSNLLEQGKIKLQSAEESLIESDKDNWQEVIRMVYNSRWMNQRVISEFKGAADFRAGKYKIKKYEN